MENSVKDLVVLYHPGCLQHDVKGHIEGPDRLMEVMTLLNASGVWEAVDLRGQCPATERDIDTVHSPAYRERVSRLCRRGVGMIGNSVPVSRRSYEAALVAAGGALGAVDGVLSGVYRRALALVRPPGHHALPDMAMGFCIFNNPALAIKRARQLYGVQRILVVDWDAHHGNGVERCFYRDPGVLYFSIHRDYAYPVTGWIERQGEGAGKGFNVNVPLPLKSGNADYRAVVEKILIPLAGEYRPELVVVCAGFDAHAKDPIGGMNLTDDGFSWLCRQVLDIARKHAGGRVVATLEGGYNPGVLAQNVLEMVRVWSPGPARDVDIKGTPKDETLRVLERIRQINNGFWNL